MLFPFGPRCPRFIIGPCAVQVGISHSVNHIGVVISMQWLSAAAFVKAPIVSQVISMEVGDAAWRMISGIHMAGSRHSLGNSIAIELQADTPLVQHAPEKYAKNSE